MEKPKPKTKVKIVAIGECPECSKLLRRPYPVNVTVCLCSNPPITISLEPAIQVGKRRYIRVEKLAQYTGLNPREIIATLGDVTVEEFMRESISDLVKRRK